MKRRRHHFSSSNWLLFSQVTAVALSRPPSSSLAHGRYGGAAGRRHGTTGMINELGLPPPSEGSRQRRTFSRALFYGHLFSLLCLSMYLTLRQTVPTQLVHQINEKTLTEPAQGAALRQRVHPHRIDHVRFLCILFYASSIFGKHHICNFLTFLSYPLKYPFDIRGSKQGGVQSHFVLYFRTINSGNSGKVVL